MKITYLLTCCAVKLVTKLNVRWSVISTSRSATSWGTGAKYSILICTHNRACSQASTTCPSALYNKKWMCDTVQNIRKKLNLQQTTGQYGMKTFVVFAFSPEMYKTSAVRVWQTRAQNEASLSEPHNVLHSTTCSSILLTLNVLDIHHSPLIQCLQHFVRLLQRYEQPWIPTCSQLWLMSASVCVCSNYLQQSSRPRQTACCYKGQSDSRVHFLLLVTCTARWQNQAAVHSSGGRRVY